MSTPKYNNFGIYHYEHGPVVICGTITINGGAIVGVAGHGFTAAYTGAGDYLVTFTDGFDHLLACTTAHHGLDVKVGTFTAGVAGACTLQLLCSEDTAVAATWVGGIDPVNDESVSFIAILSTEFQP